MVTRERGQGGELENGSQKFPAIRWISTADVTCNMIINTDKFHI